MNSITVNLTPNEDKYIYPFLEEKLKELGLIFTEKLTGEDLLNLLPSRIAISDTVYSLDIGKVLSRWHVRYSWNYINVFNTDAVKFSTAVAEMVIKLKSENIITFEKK